MLRHRGATTLISTALVTGIIGWLIGSARGQKPVQSEQEVASVPNPLAPFPLSLPNLSREEPYLGLDPKIADHFWEKWKLLTVRYRKDNGELRFIYANDLAWEGIRRGVKEMPQGAIFAKAAYSTTEDPSFPVSAVPWSPTRVQLMLKNTKKYPSTGGWGYAIYMPRSVNPPLETPEVRRNTVMSCYACHMIVRDKDYVFSEPIFDESLRTPGLGRYSQKFIPTPVEELAENIRPQIAKILKPTLATQVKFLTMPLFEGSIDESIAPISNYAEKEKVPFLLTDNKADLYLLAFPGKSTSVCLKPVEVVISLGTIGTPAHKRKIKRLRLCSGTIIHSQMELISE